MSIKAGDIVKDDLGGHYAVTNVQPTPEGDLLGLRDVATKHAYINVPAGDVVLVPGLRERV